MNGFGVIVVNGPVHLGGTLDVQLGQGFTPKVGSTYEFITFTPGSYDGSLFASVLNGVFNNGTEMWVLVYNNAGGYIELDAQPNAVPEPSSLRCSAPDCWLAPASSAANLCPNASPADSADSRTKPLRWIRSGCFFEDGSFHDRLRFPPSAAAAATSF